MGKTTINLEGFSVAFTRLLSCTKFPEHITQIVQRPGHCGIIGSRMGFGQATINLEGFSEAFTRLVSCTKIKEHSAQIVQRPGHCGIIGSRMGMSKATINLEGFSEAFTGLLSCTKFPEHITQRHKTGGKVSLCIGFSKLIHCHLGQVSKQHELTAKSSKRNHVQQKRCS